MLNYKKDNHENQTRGSKEGDERKVNLLTWRNLTIFRLILLFGSRSSGDKLIVWEGSESSTSAKPGLDKLTNNLTVEGPVSVSNNKSEEIKKNKRKEHEIPSCGPTKPIEWILTVVLKTKFNNNCSTTKRINQIKPNQSKSIKKEQKEIKFN